MKRHIVRAIAVAVLGCAGTLAAAAPASAGWEIGGSDGWEIGGSGDAYTW